MPLPGPSNRISGLSATTFTTDRGRGWVVIRLFAPDGLNKLGTGTLETLRDKIRDLVSRSGLQCLALVGEGGSFAAGADLREILRMNPASARAFSDLGNSIFRSLANSSAVVVAGIDGICLGGGLDLALSADWRLATDRSVLGHPGSDLGLITGFGGTQRLSRLIGERKTLALLMSAERISAEQAYGYGLVQEVCGQDEFETRLKETVQRFASFPGDHIAEMKRRFLDLGYP